MNCRLYQFLNSAIYDRDVHSGGSSAWFWAAACGNIDSIRMFLEQGLNPGTTDRAGRTAMSHAAERGNVQILELLCESGEKLNTQQCDISGRHALWWASQRGHTATVQFLLRDGQDCVNLADPYGTTPLSVASIRGHQEVVELLLAYVAVEFDKPDLSDKTPLFLAAENGHVAIVDRLLVRGANILQLNDDGQSALVRAATNGQVGVVNILLAASNVFDTGLYVF